MNRHKKPKTKDIIPAPIIPVTSKEDPVFVNLPKSTMASGQTAGHKNALANPKTGNKYTAVEQYYIVMPISSLKSQQESSVTLLFRN